MSDTPNGDARITAGARILWERGGCPKGGEATYYEQARALIGMEDNPQSGQIDVGFARMSKRRRCGTILVSFPSGSATRETIRAWLRGRATRDGTFVTHPDHNPGLCDALALIDRVG